MSVDPDLARLEAAVDAALGSRLATPAPLSIRDTPKTYRQQLPAFDRCSSCSGVINQQTGECRCSD